MIDRDYLLKEGFKKSTRCPLDVEEYEREIGYRQYISVRFYPAKSEHATGLFAYSESKVDKTNTRKVVLNDTIVTKKDLELAKQLCKLN